MDVDYGTMGRIGLLTPQANPTVEPEFSRMIMSDVGLYTARLVSHEPDAKRRLVHYLENLGSAVDQFGGMALDAIGFACTGSNYLVTPDHAKSIFDRESLRIGIPIVSAADAIKAAFAEIGVRRLSLLSPYPTWLTNAAVSYWQACGYEIVQVVRVGQAEGDTRPIYELGSADALRAAASLAPGIADAILVTGTGLPSLSILGPLSKKLHCPVLSSNLCLAQALSARAGQHRIAIRKV